MKKHTSILILAALTACRDPQLVPLEKGDHLNYVTVDARFCTSPADHAKQNNKYIFVIDHSQSNQPGFPNPLTPLDVTSTDPNGSRRYGPLVQFVDNLVPDPNNPTFFTLIDFSDIAVQPLGLSGFDSNPSDFVNNYVIPDWIGSGTARAPLPNDAGFTNYQGALQLALSVIKADLQSQSLVPQSPVVTNNYQIVFVTDGVPTVASTPGAPDPVYTQTFLGDISPVITSLLNLRTDPLLGPYISGISLNTAYYYQSTQVVSAEALLQQMAQAGNGQYMSFGAGAGVLYQSFAPPVRNIKYNLAEVWIENLNAVWWDDGTLMLDSDEDGLPDGIETQYGSNPYSPDSDGNGVSDLVEFRTKGAPCRDAHCGSAGRDPYAMCDGFSPTVAANGSVTFPSSAGDGMNDCEKYVLGANRTIFDSNGDFIPDLMSFKNNLAFIAGTNSAFVSLFSDPLSNYQKLKAGYPLSISQSKLINDFQARVNTLVHEDSPNPDVECYHFTAENVAALDTGNNIKVTYIQNNAVIDNKPIIMSAVHPADGYNGTVSFNAGDFQ